jgi:hypothetical protein
MLNGFANETEPLTGYELEQLLPVIAGGLRHHVGESRAVTNGTIVGTLTRLGYKISTARVRKIINHIRTNGIVQRLVATSKGYYIATDADELREYIDSLKGRENAIRSVRESMERQLEEWN